MTKYREVPRQQYQASAEQLNLWPDVSGNDINGLGEKIECRPRPIYWHDPSETPHGKLQVWMQQHSAQNPPPGRQALQAERQKVYARTPVPISATQINKTSTQWQQAVKKLAADLGAELVGTTQLDPLWVFEGKTASEPWVIVLGVVMDHDTLNLAPEAAASNEVVRQYIRGEQIARDLADWIRQQGYHAEGHCGPMAGRISLVPAALACGFGELGKHGSIINRQYGASFRLACVLTDLPLKSDEPDLLHVDDICMGCQICEKDCPAGAISDSKQMVRGVEKWYVDFDKCLPFFNEHHGCALCLAVCPWSTPGRAPRISEKVEKRRARTQSKD